MKRVYLSLLFGILCITPCFSLILARGTLSAGFVRTERADALQSCFGLTAGAGLSVTDALSVYILLSTSVGVTDRTYSDFVRVPGYAEFGTGIGVSLFGNSRFRLSVEQGVCIRSLSFLEDGERGFEALFSTTLCPRYIANPKYGVSICAQIRADYSATHLGFSFGLGGCIEV